MGIRVCESQTGTNYLSFSGGTAIYCNPAKNSHFLDENSWMPGHWLGGLKADGLYLISNTDDRPTYTWNCGLAGKALFECCIFVNSSDYSGTWMLYGSNANNSSAPYPSILELNGCDQGSMITNLHQGYVTKRRDVEIAGTGLLDDFPMRVVYRKRWSFSSAVPAGTWLSLVPADMMTEVGASYLLAIDVSIPGIDQLAMVANVAAVTKNGARAASGPISVPTSANFWNDLVRQIALRYKVTEYVPEAGWCAGIEVSVNVPLVANSTIAVTLVRVANPRLDY
jgi:hypothetical protein